MSHTQFARCCYTPEAQGILQPEVVDVYYIVYYARRTPMTAEVQRHILPAAAGYNLLDLCHVQVQHFFF